MTQSHQNQHRSVPGTLRAGGVMAVAVGLLVSACSGSTSPSTSGSAAGSGTAASTSASATATVKPGGVLKIGSIDYVDSFNPFNYIESAGALAQLMIFPSLVQYKPGAEEFEGDLADSWQQSADGKTLTFTLKSGGTWSDGKPITADDVAFTVNTTVKFKDGPTGTMATAVPHVVKATAATPTSLVISYDAPVANALPLLQTLPILPRHVWEPLAAGDGKKLKTFVPEQQLPIVSGGAYSLEKYEKKGTSVFKANKTFYGPTSLVDAVAYVYFTNEDAMLTDLKAAKIDWAEEVPITAATKLKDDASVVVVEIPGSETTNITWNSNPKKKKHRELLDPQVKKALSQTVDRARILDVVFGGHASTVESITGHIVGPWENTNLGPLTRDVAAANAALDKLGYAKGSDGIRVAPAKAGQPAHPMKYEVIQPDSLNFNGKREFEIIRDNFAEVGVTLTLKAGGDSTAAYALETGDTCDAEKGTGYEDFDLAVWDWVGYKDPDFMLSVATKAQWCSWSDTGYDNPALDKLYEEQGTLIDPAKRKVVVDQIQKIVYDDVVYTQLVNMNQIEAHGKAWGGFLPELNTYSKIYWTGVGKLG
jgi:peptide/nickel transport system substrate-binding protein